MSLTGNLDLFPMEEVLRLLARTNRTGCLHVNGAGITGRLFVVEGGISYATTQSGDDLTRRVTTARLAVAEDIDSIHDDETLGDILADGVTPEMVEEFVFDLVVETLDLIQREGGGEFEFSVDEKTAFPTGVNIDADRAVTAAAERTEEWKEIESVIPDMQAALQMVTRLSDDTAVKVSPQRWRVLAQLRGKMNIPKLADALGSSEFSVAKEVADLVREGLVEFLPEVVEPESKPVSLDPESGDLEPGPETATKTIDSETVEPSSLDPEDLEAVDQASDVEAEGILEEVLEEAEKIDESAKAIVEEVTGAPRFQPIRGKKKAAQVDDTVVERYVEPTDPVESVDKAIAEAIGSIGTEDTNDEGSKEDLADPTVNPWSTPSHGVTAPGAGSFWGDAEPEEVVVEDPWREERKGPIPEVEPETSGGKSAKDEKSDWAWDSVASDDSKWVTPEESAAEEDAAGSSPEVDWWGKASDEPAEVAAEEADTFLEDVFSQLNQEVGNKPDEKEKADGEPEQGLGILKRRRMGKRRE